MAMTLQLDGVNFGFQALRDDAGNLTAMILAFTDPSGVARVLVPFDAQSWVNFKRQVAADGAVTPIALARDLSGVPRMDIPKGV